LLTTQHTARAGRPGLTASWIIALGLAFSPAIAPTATYAQSSPPAANELAQSAPQSAIAAGQPDDADTDLAPQALSPRFVVDVASGAVIEHRDAFQRWYPASLTKLMTTYVAFRAVAAGEVTMQSPVTLSRRAAEQPPSKMYYGTGATMTLDNAIKIIMVKSANDVALAIGESLAGSEAAFVERMNREAARLGMSGTRFSNPHGLPGEGQYTNARDMAVLAVALRREFPQYASYFALEAIQAGETTYPNFNMLIGRFEGADGMKTGYICSSGFNQVASATRGGRTVVSVVFGATSLADRAEESARLLHKGVTATETSGETLATLAPYGQGRDVLVDLRPVICSPEARTARGEGRDDNGELIINSSYILPLTRELTPVRVALGGTDGAVAFIASNIPTPTPRPEPFTATPAQAATGTVGAETAGAATTGAETASTAELRPSLSVPVPVPRPAL
jgi:D-alanyl-D-alanine carboxypeptidase